MEKANNFHSKIKFTAEMSETEITFFDTKVYRGVRFPGGGLLPQILYRGVPRRFVNPNPI